MGVPDADLCFEEVLGGCGEQRTGILAVELVDQGECVGLGLFDGVGREADSALADRPMEQTGRRIHDHESGYLRAPT